MRTLADVRTPALVLDRSIVERNTRAMARRAAELGVDLRPHMKTAKSAHVARLATESSSGAITVSTLAEAFYFASEGFRDITYAVGVVPSKLDDVAALESRGGGPRIQVLTDDVGVARAICERGAALDTDFRVLLEIDTGLHRTGFDATGQEFLDAARILHDSPHAVLAGVLTHAGNSYDHDRPQDILRVAREERDGAVAAAERLRRAGIPCPTVSVGSTPTAVHVDHLDGVTEMRPGNYVFFDTFQWLIGSCERAAIGVSVLATVIAHKPDFQRLLIDAGGLALSKDLSPAAHGHDIGYGIVVGEDGRDLPGNAMRVVAVNQEHGFVECHGEMPFDSLPIGSRVRVLPNHSCMTAAAYPAYEVVDGGAEIVSTWPRVNGW